MGSEAPVVSGNPERILVIKLGALGDVIQALGPMRAIREHHPNAEITCMTTAPFRDLIQQTGFCDLIWEHRRPSNIDLMGWITLRVKLRAPKYQRVYDLQTSSRSNRFYKLIWPGPYPEWSGNAPGCSHPHKNPARNSMHTLERQAEQLADAGISNIPPPTLDGLGEDISHLNLPADYCLVVPGGAAHRPEKRWPASCYRDAIAKIAAMGIAPVIVGTRSEGALARSICDGVDEAINLVDQTSLLSLVSLAKGAKFALGNDSGPMHISAIAGVPSVVLYSHASDPDLCAQRGPSVVILRKPSLDDVTVKEVLNALPSGNP
jgi:ADP-heptose:LPS heptosyltransferase